jgi:hypothetical protein
MSETDMIAVGDPLPKLASVEPANSPTSVSVAWASGSRAGMTEIIDLAPMIYTFKVFRPLRDDPALFRTVHLGEWGASIIWKGHDDLDIGADALEELAREQMTPEDFQAFMKRLGISRRLVAYYAKERLIPRTVALACKYIDMSHRDEKQLTSPVDLPSHVRLGFATSSCRHVDVAGLLEEQMIVSVEGKPFFAPGSLSHSSFGKELSYWKTATNVPPTVKGAVSAKSSPAAKSRRNEKAKKV